MMKRMRGMKIQMMTTMAMIMMNIKMKISTHVKTKLIKEIVTPERTCTVFSVY